MRIERIHVCDERRELQALAMLAEQAVQHENRLAPEGERAPAETPERAAPPE